MLTWEVACVVAYNAINENMRGHERMFIDYGSTFHMSAKRPGNGSGVSPCMY